MKILIKNECEINKNRGSNICYVCGESISIDKHELKLRSAISTSKSKKLVWLHINCVENILFPKRSPDYNYSAGEIMCPYCNKGTNNQHLCRISFIRLHKQCAFDLIKDVQNAKLENAALLIAEKI